MRALIGLAAALAGLVLGLLVLRSGNSRLSQSQAVTYRLSFPAGLEEAAVLEFVSGLSGLLMPWWRQLSNQPVVTFEVLATAAGLEHRLAVPCSCQALVTAAMTAHIPSVRYTQVEDPSQTDHEGVRIGAEYRTSSNQRLLRTEVAALSSGLLSSLQPLSGGELIIVQWIIIAPSGPIQPARLRSRTDASVLGSNSQVVDSSEALSALKAKQSQPLFLGVGRIAVGASSRARAEQLLRQAESAWHTTRTPGVHLSRRSLPVRSVAERAERRAVPVSVFPAVLNSEELAGLLGWPVGVSQLPGLTLGSCRLLPVASSVPKHGTLLGISTFPATAGRPVAIDRKARLVHLLAMGPTGSGKSTLLTRIVLSDIEAGYGVVVLDPKGDLITPILERMDERRLDEVIVLDAADDQRPVGYNPLACTEDNRELVVEQTLGVTHSIWKQSWGPRMHEIWMASLLTLTAVPGMTLAEVPRLLSDERFRRHLVSQIHDPFGVDSFWATFDSWSKPEQVTNTAAVLNKARSFAMRSRLRGVLGQAHGAVKFDRIIRERQILLVNLASGRLGSEAAYLLGALLFSGLWDAVSARAGTAENDRPVVMATLDEFQHLVALPTPAETVLAEARG